VAVGFQLEQDNDRPHAIYALMKQKEAFLIILKEKKHLIPLP